MQIIGVNLKDRHSDSYQGKAYNYFCDIDDLAVGDLLAAPTKDGDATVRVCAVGVDPETIDPNIKLILKTITKRADEVVEVIPVNGETDLIVIQQLPVIVEQLHSIKAAVSEKVKSILALPCTDETVKEIKKYRADLNKDFKDFEARRKFVKSEILKPYEAFEMVYRECVTEIFNEAETQLKEAIDDIETAIKQGKANEISEFYREELAAHGLDFPSFGQSGIKVGLSDTITALKKQASEIISKTAEDVAMINGLPFADEIMVEYRASLNASRSIMTINARHKAIEEQRARMETAPNVTFEPIPVPAAVPHIIVPTKTDDEVSATIRVIGSQRKIDALMKFLEDGWYKYETI